MRKHSVWLCLLVLISVFSILPNVYAVQQGKLFNGQPIYLRRTLVGISDYMTLQTGAPTLATPVTKTIIAAPGEYYLGSWASPSIPNERTIEYFYNFLFSMWASGNNGGATIFGRFYLYRNASELLLFQTSDSNVLSSTQQAMLWQYKTQHSQTFISQDRVVLKLYFRILVSGTYNFYFDGRNTPSYLSDPTETRYMRNDQQTINGLTGYILNTTQSSLPATSVVLNIYDGSVYVTQYLGIRVWLRMSNSTEHEVTSGTAIAIASGSGTTFYSATWSCPQHSMATTDAVKVIVYGDDFSPPTTAKVTLITEQLSNTQLDSSTWTVYYYLTRTYSGGSKLTTYRFTWGASTANSRIEGFSHSTPSGGETTLNLYGTINIVFTIHHTNEWSFSLIGIIIQQFTVGFARALTVNLNSAINQAYTVSNLFTSSALLTLIGIIIQTFTLTSTKVIAFNRVGTITTAFTIQGNTTAAVFLNLVGTITQTFLVTAQQAWEFTRSASINPNFTVTSSVSGLGRILNLFGSIIQTFTVQTLTQITSTKNGALVFAAGVMLAVPIIIIVSVIIWRMRK